MVCSNERGFTLIELIIALSLSIIVISIVFSVYNFGYSGYKAIENTIEVQQNLRVSLNRINGNIRLLEKPKDKVKIQQGRLIVDTYEYYRINDILYEKKGFGINQLATRITHVSFVIDDDILTIDITGGIPEEGQSLTLSNIICLDQYGD